MVFLIITIYWFYRGLRRGLYPALNILFVFFVPLLITLNYYDLLFGVVAKIKPDTTQSAREAISFVATYLITFFICVYFCLWLCAEELRMDKTIDTIAGGILGIVTGMICCGVLMLIWFSTPFSRLPQFEVSDTDMFYRPQDYALEAATIVADRVKGEREFSGERFLRDLRYGLPQVPTLGAGFYISSVPTGLKVFIEPGGGSPAALLVKIKERLNNPERDIPPSEQREVQVEKGRTPLFLHENSATALIAVVMESVPADLAQVAADEPDRLFRQRRRGRLRQGDPGRSDAVHQVLQGGQGRRPRRLGDRALPAARHDQVCERVRGLLAVEDLFPLQRRPGRNADARHGGHAG